MSHTTTSKTEHEVKGAVADTKKEVHKEQAKDSNESTGTRAKAAAKVPGDKMEAETLKNQSATDHPTKTHSTKIEHDHSKVDHTKKEVHKEQAKDHNESTGTRAKAAAKVPGDKMESEAHKNHPSTSDHPTKTHSTKGDHEIKGDHTSKTSMKTTTKDGTKIKVEGAGSEIPSLAHPPSNKQIDSVLHEAHHDLEKEKPHLDSHGKEIASSTQNVIDATSLLLNKKNKEQRFQRLFLFTQGTAQEGSSEAITKATKNLMTQATGLGSKISNDATDSVGYIRETIFNLTTSGEFRQLTIEFLNLLQSFMGQLKTAIATTDSNEPLKANKLKSQVTFDTEEDRLDDINEKLAVFLKSIGKNPQYKSIVINFMKYSEEIYDALYKAKSDASATKEHDNLRKTLDEGWEILNDFVGDNKLVPKFKKNLTVMAEKLRKDEELIVWMKECKAHLTELIEHPENASKDKKQTSKLIKTGGNLTDKYRSDLDRLYSEASRIIDRIQTDPVFLNFQQNLEQLGRDIALNSQGQPDLFVIQKSMNVIRDLLAERFRKVLIDVPIDRVRITSDSMDMTLKNISIQGHGLVPNNLRVEMTSISGFNFERSTDAAQKFRIRLRVDQIRPHFKGVKFNYKKTSFPSIKDKGIADIIFEGNGLSVDVALQFSIASHQISKVHFENCTVDVDKVNLKIEEAKHDLLGAIFAPMIQSRLQTKIQTGVYEFVHGRVGQIIDQLNRWFKTRPFESMMVRGNESLQTAMEKKEEKKVTHLKEEKSKRKLEEGKKELTAEERQKKKEKKLQQQKDGTYVKLDKHHNKDGYQQQPVTLGQQPMLDQQPPTGQQPLMMGQQHPMAQPPPPMMPVPGYAQQPLSCEHNQFQQPLSAGQQHHNPNIAQTGLQTQQHFQHPPADHQPNQHQQHFPNATGGDATLGQQSAEVGSVDRINKLLDPNFVSQVKEQPSS